MRHFYFLIILLCAFTVNAQIVNIPDVNLKNELLGHVPAIDTNGDNEIQVTEALAAPTQMFLTSANIADLTGIEAFTNLTFLNVAGNNLTTINLNGLVNLTGFNADYNQLTSVNFGNADNFATFSVNDNNLTTFDVSGKTIENLYCTGNAMTQINLAGAQIQELRCQENALTSLDVSLMSSLQELYCYSNQITSLNFLNCPMLWRVYCQDNPIEALDFSMNPILFEVAISNPQLEYVNFKNGSASAINLSALGDLDNLLRVCADEDDIAYWENFFSIFGTDAFVSAYCNFVPGGTYNTINGGLKHDLASDGCGANEPMMPHCRLNVSDGTSSGAVLTNGDGLYNIYAGTGTLTVTPEPASDYFTVTPASAQITFSDTENNVTPQDFCMARNGIHNDLDVTIVPGIPARPGFEATYIVTYHNKGTETMSGTVKFLYMEDLMDFVSADPVATTQAPGMLEWAYTDLQPFESRTALVTLIMNTPTDTPPVTIGMQVDFAAFVYPIEGDETPGDNFFGYKQTIVGSFDPNDIACLQGDVIAPDMVGEYLHYLIRFQNSGTYYAENVLVTDVIDPLKFDIGTLDMIGTSHPGITRITGNKVEFIFQDIMLPAEQDDEPGSHGYVAFKIRSRNNLVVGNSVSQYADIYFDFNPPITTNTATTTIQLLGTGDFAVSGLKVFPNPVKDQVSIQANEMIKSVSLSDLSGRVLEVFPSVSDSVILDMGNQSAGVYLLKIEGQNAVQTVKIVKN